MDSGNGILFQICITQSSWHKEFPLIGITKLYKPFVYGINCIQSECCADFRNFKHFFCKFYTFFNSLSFFKINMFW